jgi:NADPH:quinone reductase-like Zn-dependent oxidoreductase
MHTARMHALLGGIGIQMARGGLEMPIEKEFALSDVGAAHRFVAEGHPFGRVLMHPA